MPTRADLRFVVRLGAGKPRKEEQTLYKHEKQLLHPVRVERPNHTYAALLQEQLGGPNGEL